MSLIKQQSKIDWIKYGDNCTRFFFAKIKQRKPTTYTYSIEDVNGQNVEGFDNVGQAMLQYYKGLLGTQHTRTKQIDKDIIAQGATISKEQQINLCKGFSDQDIQNALFSIPHIKSPGLDGYNSGFLKTTWSRTGSMASIFILPNDVLVKITQVCRNFL
ncbi:hypothetical protein Cgig2_000308 [Carnegiea gigantea]|uniref:Uncharacterized protein n=1 Tax=Carnegiea gigantea TaxID=171969 RepID=A0A9Q1GFP4_9CARY|nr:hypothetical protein Cgig2_000308 [Carnegiea gigantea]